MADHRFGALILAAGLSSRMRGFKPLMNLGGKPLIHHVIDLFESTNIEEIVTVVGHRSDELIPVVEQTSSRWVINHQYHDGMFSSIQQGVQKFSQSCSAFFLLPVDMPLVRPETIYQLLEVFTQKSSIPVCYPEFMSRKGHPPLLNSSLINEILDYNGQGGMRNLLRKYDHQACVTPVADKYILMDADTEEDFALLKEIFSPYYDQLSQKEHKD